jgi:hypothetical protein
VRLTASAHLQRKIALNAKQATAKFNLGHEGLKQASTVIPARNKTETNSKTFGFIVL